MKRVQCWVCEKEFDVYPSRYELCKHKRFFCSRACKDSAQVKTPEERTETALMCNRRARDSRYVERRALIDGVKLKNGCADCGYRDHPEALQFDHRVPLEKEFAIGVGWNMGLGRLLKEMAKCAVRCANCHAVRTAAQRSTTKMPRDGSQRGVFNRLSLPDASLA